MIVDVTMSDTHSEHGVSDSIALFTMNSTYKSLRLAPYCSSAWAAPIMIATKQANSANCLVMMLFKDTIGREQNINLRIPIPVSVVSALVLPVRVLEDLSLIVCYDTHTHTHKIFYCLVWFFFLHLHYMMM